MESQLSAEAGHVVLAVAAAGWGFAVVHPDSVDLIAHSLPLLLLRPIEGLI